MLFCFSVLISPCEACSSGFQPGVTWIECFEAAVFRFSPSEVTRELHGASQTQMIFSKQRILRYLFAPQLDERLTGSYIFTVANDGFA